MARRWSARRLSTFACFESQPSGCWFTHANLTCTQFDLDLSVEKGLWATQRHNESVLDQAYRTSKEVYLIFGVNKSGEFYGYAK